MEYYEGPSYHLLPDPQLTERSFIVDADLRPDLTKGLRDAMAASVRQASPMPVVELAGEAYVTRRAVSQYGPAVLQALYPGSTVYCPTTDFAGFELVSEWKRDPLLDDERSWES